MRLPAPLRRAPFRRLTFAWTASNLADSALYLMLAVWVKELTGSDAAAGMTFLFLGLPALVAPLAGRLADSMSRKLLLVITNALVAAGVLALLMVRDVGDLWMIYVVTTLYGAAQYLTGAAQSGLLRDMLPDEELASANGLFTTIDQGFRIIAPLFGAGLYALAGPHAVVIVTAVSFAVAAALLATMRVRETASAPDATTFSGMWEGFRILFSQPTLRTVVIAVGAAFGITGLLNIIAFALIEQGLGLPPEALGPITTVQGVGAILGGITAAKAIGSIGERRVVAFGIALLAVCLLGATAVVLTIEPGGWLGVSLAGAAWAIGGFGISWSVVAAVTLRMRTAPAHVQGRASSAMNMLLNAPQTIIMAIGAGLILAVDYRVLLVISAAVLVAVAASLRPWRRGDRHDVGAETSVAHGT